MSDSDTDHLEGFAAFSGEITGSFKGSIATDPDDVLVAFKPQLALEAVGAHMVQRSEVILSASRSGTASRSLRT